MKHSLTVMSFATAIFVTGAILPSASAQTQPANPPAQTQPANPTTPTPKQVQLGTGNKAKGAAAGAALGAATGGSAAKGAIVGAGHSRREQRRDARHNK